MDAQEVVRLIKEFPRHFICENCGHCCTEFPKTALVEGDVEMMSYHLGISHRKFKDTYTFIEGKDRFMRQPCAFWDKVCKIYPARPAICRVYPLVFTSPKDIALSGSCKGRLRE